MDTLIPDLPWLLLGLRHEDASSIEELPREDVTSADVIHPIEDLHIRVHVQVEYGDELAVGGWSFWDALAVN